MLKKMRILWFLVTAIAMTGCTNDNNSPQYPVQFRLTDAPGEYDAVLIDVQRVEVHTDGNANNNSGGWTTINTNARVYDLTRLVNGKDTLLADAVLPYGKISQIRLVLGNNNSVVVDGVTHPLSTPSGQTSGVKLNLHQTLTEGVTYVITLDFDASRSIVEKGGGGYALKPVIRAYTQATSGAIKGKVDPDTTFANVYAVMGNDSFGTMTNSTGNFLIPGLAAGNYDVKFVVPSMGNKVVSKPASVTIGQVTDMGTVDLK